MSIALFTARMTSYGEIEKERITVKPVSFVCAILFWVITAGMITDRAIATEHDSAPDQIPILMDWRGDYPVSELYRLPEGQRSSRIGYLGSREQFADIWQKFKPGERLPEVDFNRHIVIFSRNVQFYNRTGIARVTLKDGVAEILAVETLSALPIEDKVAMALAVISRSGVKYIGSGDERIPVRENSLGALSDPLNTVYTIEGCAVALKNGFSEVATGPDSATNIRTFISGKPVYGDLDGDGDEDTALILVHDPGGSGTFYYIAVTENLNGGYQGTAAILLGDRVRITELAIRRGIVIVRYADRHPHEPMSAAPSVEKRVCLAFDKGNLTILPSSVEEGQ